MKKVFLLFFILCFSYISCGKKTDSKQAAPAAESVKAERFEGVLIFKELPQTKSVEAWLGEEYFLYIRKEEKTIVLWPTESVPEEKLREHLGKVVEIDASWRDPKPYVPENDYESYPTDTDGNPLKRGGGYYVTSIKRAD